jgi:hypothetical protein
LLFLAQPRRVGGRGFLETTTNTMPTPWITLSENDAHSVVNVPLMKAAREKVVLSGQPDPLVEKLSQAIGRVRGAIGASGKYILGAGETVPPRLKATTLDLFAVMILGRLDLEISEVKMTLYKSAEATLRDVRDGTFAIDDPETPTAETESSPTPRITPRCRHFTREDGDGA